MPSSIVNPSVPMSSMQEEGDASGPSLPEGGHKGYGKGNFGTAIPPPEVVDQGDADEVPPPIPATTADVESWMQTFTPFHATN